MSVAQYAYCSERVPRTRSSAVSFPHLLLLGLGRAERAGTRRAVRADAYCRRRHVKDGIRVDLLNVK